SNSRRLRADQGDTDANQIENNHSRDRAYDLSWRDGRRPGLELYRAGRADRYNFEHARQSNSSIVQRYPGPAEPRRSESARGSGRSISGQARADLLGERQFTIRSEQRST